MKTHGKHIKDHNIFYLVWNFWNIKLMDFYRFQLAQLLKSPIVSIKKICVRLAITYFHNVSQKVKS